MLHAIRASFRHSLLVLATLGVLATPATGQAQRADAALPQVVGGEALPSLAPMLERVTPAVVNIATRGRPPARNPLLDDPFFRRFFDLEPLERSRRPQSLGSGVIVDASRGLVVTNNHVIENAAEILITLSDGRELPATRIGTDPQADIAVVRIEADRLTALPWSDSETLRVGDFCVAIGNPFGLGQTVTSGIVSALGRSGLGIEDFEDFIQTDASINPGNSGGALVNLAGELIGINTAIVGPSGGNVGIGFAIPSNMARDIVEQLVESGEVRRGALGIAAQPLTAELASAFGVDRRRGVIVGHVRPNSPAEKAGLEVGDIITAIDGRPVRNVGDVRNRIGLVRLGQDLKIDVIRNGRPLTLEATVELLQLGSPLLDGAELANARTASGQPYVRIEAVARGSLVARAGLAAGDIILSVNRRRVTTVEELEVASDGEMASLLLLVQRGQSTRYVRLQAG